MFDKSAAPGIYDQAVNELGKKSARAKEIIDQIARLSIDVILEVGDFGQGSGFTPKELGGGSKSVLRWDSKHVFNILVNPTEQTKAGWGGKMVTTTSAKLSPLPANIVLIHELGHVLQYAADPAGFVAKANTTAGMAEIERLNLKDTEWPVCADYGICTRSNYLHYDGTNDPIASKWKKV